MSQKYFTRKFDRKHKFSKFNLFPVELIGGDESGEGVGPGEVDEVGAAPDPGALHTAAASAQIENLSQRRNPKEADGEINFYHQFCFNEDRHDSLKAKFARHDNSKKESRGPNRVVKTRMNDPWRCLARKSGRIKIGQFGIVAKTEHT